MSLLSNLFKKISALMFALILICFFLPFITVTLAIKNPLSGISFNPWEISGLQIATGGELPKDFPNDRNELERSFDSGNPPDRKVAGTLAAGLAFCTANIGLLFTFLLKNRRKYLILAITGSLGILLLLSTKYYIDTFQNVLIQISYNAGFWISFLLFVCIIGLNSYQYINYPNRNK